MLFQKSEEVRNLLSSAPYQDTMNTNTILANIYQYVQLNEEETAFLESILIARPFKQGELIVRAGDTARYLMYVNDGYVMTYHTGKDGLDHVIQFASSGWWCGDIYSLSKEPNTLFSTKGLCDGELLLLPRLVHSQLLEKYSKMERYFRMLFQHVVIRQQLRFLESYTDSAEDRYTKFINTYPGMEQYVPQKYIASYLGITPEFLSKVRKKIASKKAR